MKNLNLLWACLFLMACHQQQPTASLERTLGNEAQWILPGRILANGFTTPNTR